MAGNRRTRRLIEEAPTGQRTLDPSPPVAEPLPEAKVAELLEPPVPQHASFKLEERQARWFQIREQASENAGTHDPAGSDSTESGATDPKG
jgi:hypothetical protein